MLQQDNEKLHRLGGGKLVVATFNKGKVAEFEAALAGLNIQLIPLKSIPGYQAPAEEGETFAANAVIKAKAAANFSGLPAVADDSGLEVDALRGAPGVYSARFGGPALSDHDRCILLLEKMTGIPKEQRTARYIAAIALCHPGAEPVVFHGTVEGWIGTNPKGSYGFGYDPIFYLRDTISGEFLDKSMAELTIEEKSAISHRGKALAQFRQYLVLGNF